MDWKYISNNTGEIEYIYCSNVDMKIPIVYYWTVLFKDGREYDLTDPVLKIIVNKPIDKKALEEARRNYLLLNI